jgi:tripartite-type tricarboxylate transporter receptor subunit TctC
MPHDFALSRRALVLGLPATMLAAPVLAQGSYPAKPVRWVVGFPAGGGTDVLARTLAAPISAALGQPFIVDNRAGAAGMIAAEAVARAEPDGHTLLTADIAILALNPAIYSKVRYDPTADFVPIGLMARFPLLVATHPGSGIRSLPQLVDGLGRGAGFSYGSAGVGTPHHMAMEVLLSTTRASAQHVPYKGDAPALQDLAGGQIPLAVVAPSLSLPFVRDGKLRPLAVTSERRMPQLPDVPTLKELGYAPDGIYAWQGLVAPKGTPASVVAALSQQMRQSVKQPAVQQKLVDLGMEPIGSEPAEMDRYVREQIGFWTPLIRNRGIRAD